MRSAIEGGPAGIGPAGTESSCNAGSAPRPIAFSAPGPSRSALREWWCPPGWIAGEIEIDLRPGGTYRIEMRRIGGDERVAVRGEFLEVTPPRRLVYTWIWEGAFAEMAPTLVTVEIDGSPDETLLTLRHENFVDPGTRHQHRTGWIAACNRLDRLVTPIGEPYRHLAD